MVILCTAMSLAKIGWSSFLIFLFAIICVLCTVHVLETCRFYDQAQFPSFSDLVFKALNWLPVDKY